VKKISILSEEKTHNWNHIVLLSAPLDITMHTIYIYILEVVFLYSPRMV